MANVDKQRIKTRWPVGEQHNTIWNIKSQFKSKNAYQEFCKSLNRIFRPWQTTWNIETAIVENWKQSGKNPYTEIQSRYTSPKFDEVENSYYIPIFSLGKNHPSQSRKLLGKTNFAVEIRCRIRKLWGKKFTEKLNKTKRRSLTHFNLRKYTKIYNNNNNNNKLLMPCV